MARKTFISYKYSEARELRDSIIESMGKDATYYTGETSDSPDMTDRTTDYIREKLKDMIYSTSVTIVVISPNMIKSQWIDWEIEYSLKQVKRGDFSSGTNGIVGVVKKYNGDYTWLRPRNDKFDGCSTLGTNEKYMYDILNKNRFNQEPKVYACENCKCVDMLVGSHISLINEEDFLNDPNFYIENAYEKSKHSEGYILSKKR